MKVSAPTGRFLDVNRTFCDMVGYTRRELLRLDVTSITHPDDLESTRARIAKAAAEPDQIGGFPPYEKRYLRKDGTVLWVRVRHFGIKNRSASTFGYSIIEDLTTERRAAEDLRRSRERFEAAMQGASEGLWDWDVLTGADYFSERWCNLLGYSRAELNPHYETWVNALHPDDKPWVLDALRRHLEGKAPYDLEYRMMTRSGAYRWFAARGQAVWGDHGEPVRMAGSMSDVTDRRELEESFYRASARLQIRNAELEQMQQSQAATNHRLAATTHEIRTPLNGITALAQLLSEEDLAEGPAQLVCKLGDIASHLMRVLNDVLDQAKIEAGQMEVERVPFPVRRIVTTATKILTEWAAAKGVRLRADVAEGVPENVLGDALRIQQVLVNLLNNAVKFSANGSEVVLRVSAVGPGVRFEVIDRGIDIAPEVRERIFQRYSQAAPNTAKTYGGTGLGLSLAREFVELMDGEIGVESVLGEGSTFWFTLPAAASFVPENLAHLAGSTVLVVDDSEINQLVARRTLEKLGIRAVAALSGEDAMVKIAAERYAAILMDLNLPGADGAEVTRTLREQGVTTTILGITASDLASDRRRCLDAGMSGLIPKPLDLQVLARVLANQSVRSAAP